MASLLVTILAEIFNAKLLIQMHKKADPAGRRASGSRWLLPRNHLTVSKGVTFDIRPIFQIVKESVPGLRVAPRMFSIDGMHAIAYE